LECVIEQARALPAAYPPAAAAAAAESNDEGRCLLPADAHDALSTFEANVLTALRVAGGASLIPNLPPMLISISMMIFQLRQEICDSRDMAQLALCKIHRLRHSRQL
jgi:hypothetical protein